MKGANDVENIRHNYIVLKRPTSKEEVLLLKEQRPQFSPTFLKQESECIFFIIFFVLCLLTSNW